MKEPKMNPRPAIIQADARRAPIFVTPRENGWRIAAGGTVLLLDADETRALIEHLKDS